MSEILFDEYKNSTISEKFKNYGELEDKISKVSPNLEKNLCYLSLPSGYSRNLLKLKSELIKNFNINSILLSEENKLIKHYFVTQFLSEREISEIINKIDNRVFFNVLFRDYMSYENINQDLILKELRKSYYKLDIDSICESLCQLIPFKKISKRDKVLVDLLSFNNTSITYLLEQIITTPKIDCSNWDYLWQCSSNLNEDENPKDNHLILMRSDLIELQYDDPINQNFFPNLPEIYDKDYSLQLEIFLGSIDWNKSYKKFEIDFIMAAAIQSLDDEVLKKAKKLKVLK